MAKNSIVVVGSSNTDMIIQLAPPAARRNHPGRGVRHRGRRQRRQPGGRAARAGGRVTLVARVGRDMFGDQAVEGFVRDGIDVGCVVRTAGAVRRGPDLRRKTARTASRSPRRNGRLSPADVRKARRPSPALACSSCSLKRRSQPFWPPPHRRQVRPAGDPEPAPARQLPDALLKRISILTPNETEAELLTGIRVESTADAARAAGRRWPGACKP